MNGLDLILMVIAILIGSAGLLIGYEVRRQYRDKIR